MTAPMVVFVLVLSAAAVLRGGVRRTREARAQARLTGGRPARPPDALALARRLVERVDGALHSHDARIERELPAALEGMARSLRSGASIPQAVAEASSRAPAPLAQDLALVDRWLSSGVALEDALRSWATARPTPGVRLAAAALGLSGRLGGSGARAVDRLARSLRDRRSVQRELAALAAQARLSAGVILLAPLAFGALGLAVDGRTARFLFATPLGLACLGGALVLDLGALLWMRRIVAGVPA